jgi:hypothetical protein
VRTTVKTSCAFLVVFSRLVPMRSQTSDRTQTAIVEMNHVAVESPFVEQFETSSNLAMIPPPTIDRPHEYRGCVSNLSGCVGVERTIARHAHSITTRSQASASRGLTTLLGGVGDIDAELLSEVNASPVREAKGATGAP